MTGKLSSQEAMLIVEIADRVLGDFDYVDMNSKEYQSLYFQRIADEFNRIKMLKTK